MSGQPPRAASLLGGRYRLGGLIGRGGMAEVYRATDERLGREVAIKLFRPGVAAAEDLRRVRSEIRALAAVGHRGLVTLHDASDGDDGTPAYLVLELVPGTDLGALIRTGALGVGQTVALGGEVAEALAHIHARGIVHRDIKPENVLVARGEDGALHAKLADLGIARILGESRLTDTGSVIGTAAYLSPEQVLGREVGTEADVYALGLVLVEALTGQPCFEGGKLEQALARANRDVEVPDWLDEEDAVLLEAMTSRDPDERPTARQVAAALRAWSIRELPWDSDDAALAIVDAALPAAATAASVPTAVLPTDDRTERLPVADPTAVLPVDGALPGLAAATEVLRTPHLDAQHLDPLELDPLDEAAPDRDAATRLLPAHEDARTTVLRPDAPTAVLGFPVDRAAGDPAAAQSADESTDPRDARRRARAETRRRLSRRALVVVLVIALLCGGAVGAWPLLTAIAPTARSEAPAYPAVSGELGSSLGALEASVGSSGLSPERRTLLQTDLLALTTAAAGQDFDAADSALDLLEGDVDRAAILDEVTSARYADLRSRIADVRPALVGAREAAAAEAERRRAEEEARQERERQEQARLEEQRRQDEEKARQQEAEQKSGGFGQTLDEIGQGIRDQLDRWTGGN